MEPRPGDEGVDAKAVFVRNIPYDCREEEIREFFRDCGAITKLYLPIFEDTGRLRGIAVVSFDTPEEAERAIHKDGQKLGDREVKIQYSRRTERRRDDRDDRERRDDRRDDRRGGDFRRDDRRGGGGGRRPFVPRSPEGEGEGAPSPTVFVANLPWSATQEDVKAFFADCGEISIVRLITDRETNQPRGFGYVEFKSEEEARKAVAKSGQELSGRELRVQFARRTREDRPRGGEGSPEARGGGGGRWDFARGAGPK